MYKGFNLSINDSDMKKLLGKVPPNITGQRQRKPAYERSEKEMHNTLDLYMRPGGSLDAAKMTDDWFPDFKADIFISHSHNDKDLAIDLAYYLETVFNVTCFIDSCVWGYSNALLKQIDDKDCYNSETGTYDYERRNYTTSHVHMILATALTKMIDKCECLFFLNTPSSISVSDARKGTETNSPWLYYEILMAKFINKITPDRYEGMIKMAVLTERALVIDYPADLSHLDPLDFPDLVNWRNTLTRSTAEESLDALYNLKQKPVHYIEK